MYADIITATDGKHRFVGYAEIYLGFLGKWAALIPMATLAGILVVVAYKMREWHHFVKLLKS